MGSYSIGEAIRLLMDKSGWTPKVNEVRLREDWEIIAGKTVAKYTRNISLNSEVLTIFTDVAPLKQELQLGKDALIRNINEHYKQKIVSEIIVK